MNKKALIFIAVLAVFIFALAACNPANYPFPALTDTGGEVRYYGGTYAEKGDWSYFVNGAEVNTDNNKWGYNEKDGFTERTGGLCRVKTADLGKEGADIQIVVPKIIYSNNSDTFGFRILGDTIYYGTPNSEKNANGIVQYNKLDVMSVNINGTGTKKLFTFDSADADYMISTKGGTLFIVYVTDGELHEVNVNSSSKDKNKLIAEHIATYKFDRDRQEVFYTVTQYGEKEEGKDYDYDHDHDHDVELKYNILYKYSAGEQTLIKNGKSQNESELLDHDTISVVYAADGFVWFQAVNAKFLDDMGLFKASAGDDIIRVSSKAISNFLHYKDGGDDVLIYNDGTSIYKLTFSYKDNPKEGKLVADPDSAITGSSGGGKVLYLSKNHEYLYYSIGGIVYRVPVNKGRQESVVVTEGNTGASWVPFVFVEKDNEVWVIYNTYGIKGYEDYSRDYFYKSTYDDDPNIKDDKRISTVCISRIIEED